MNEKAPIRSTSLAALGVLLVALVLSCAFLLAGCKDSRALKNIVHDQDSETVDQEGGETFQVVTKDGRLIAEDVGLYEIGGGGVDSLPVNVFYVSDEPETELPTARFVYDGNSSNDSEASEGVNLDQPEEDPQQNDEREDDPQNSDQPRRSGNGGNRGGDPADEDPNDEGEDPDDDGGDGGEKDDENPGKDPDQPSGPEPSGAGDVDGPTIYDGTGEEPDLPDVGTIAAYGQVAVLVQMLGGADDFTPLAATDDALHASAFSRVFSDEGAGRVNGQAFIADGAGGYEPDIDQIIASQPDTVLVFTDSFFTDGEKQGLAENGISITVVPMLASDTGIMRAARNIAKMLDKSTEGRSTSMYERYQGYHDELVAEIEGDRGYGAYGGEVYDAYMSPAPRSFSAQRFTLVVDYWDYDATYNYRSAISDAGAGVGLATVGFRNSPVSYYLGVAGVVNNAAAIDVTKKGSGLLAPAWQFNPTDLSPSEVKFSSAAFSSRLYTDWGTGFVKTTLSKVDTKKLTLRESGFGTRTFPVVIVATARMRDAFISSANATGGIYRPFGWVTSDVGTIPGTLVGRTPVYTVIDENLDTSAKTKALVVNPHGLFSSWLEGSAESFLESAWAANIGGFDNSWGGSVGSEVEYFYNTFYRYPISSDEIGSVLDGLAE